MVYSEDDLKAGLCQLRQSFQKSITSIDQEFEEHVSWLQDIYNGLRKGTISGRSLLVPKTPGKRRAPLETLQESVESTFSVDAEEAPAVRRGSRATNKKGGRKGQKKSSRTTDIKILRPPTLEEDEVEEPVSKGSKRIQEDEADGTAKRMRLSTASEAVSRDSGLSSVGSRNTGGSGHSGTGINVKQEIMSPQEKSLEACTIPEEDEAESEADIQENRRVTRRTVEIGVSRLQTTQVTDGIVTQSTPETVKKRSRSAGRGTFVVKEEIRRSSRSHSEPRKSLVTPPITKPSAARVSTLQSPSFNLSPIRPTQTKTNDVIKSPALKKIPTLRLLKGDSVKKVVKAFEALNEDHEEAEDLARKMAPPAPPTSSHVTSSITSLDDAVNAPTRLTRTKTRAMAKAAASEEAKSHKDNSSVSAVPPPPATVASLTAASAAAAAKALKSPTQGRLIFKSGDDTLDKESTMCSRLGLKTFGSSNKQNSFLKVTPLNRIPLLTPSHSVSTSFTTPRINNLVTTMDSFITKSLTCHEQRPTREDNLQKLVAKAEVASKKKEEMIKAQMEEKIKKRQEKRLKVCATREAMEREKQEMQQRLEREREEKQRQLQAEREEKLRQEALKRKKLALQKAAETEERRRQEEAARIAKIKQQEEEQRKLAAQRKKEQEEAERRHQERLQQEREAAILRAKEAERAAKEAERAAKEADRAAKEAAYKTKTDVKAQLDQTYDMLPAPQSYGLTPVPEDRVPLPPKNADNYGIDDICTDDSSEDESKPKKQVPLWAQTKLRMPKLMDDCEVTYRQMAVFFGSQKSTPDLSKIFTKIDRRQLIRHSSAVWRTPPVKYNIN